MAKRTRIPRDGTGPPAGPPPRDTTPPEPHQVVSAGEGGGFGVISRDGGLEPKWFDSRKAAEDFAKAQRTFFEGLARAAAQAGQTAGTVAAQVAGHAPPPVPASGGSGPIPPQATPPIPAPAFSPGPMFPPGMYGAAGVTGPVAPPSPWPASMFSAMASGPAVPPPPPPVAPAGAWPMGMGPANVPQWPAGMTPGATSFGPPLPPGPGGFPSSMGPGYQPPPPAAPTPPNLRDVFRDLGKDLLAAIKDGQPGRFDWVKIGEALGKGVEKAGPIATAAGIPLPEAVKLGMAATRALGGRLDDVSRLVSSGYMAGQQAASINAGNRHLAGYNGAIAGAFGELNLGDFRRTYELAQATAGTTATLARSVNAAKDAWQPYEVLKSDLGNRWGIFQAARSEAVGDAASLPLDAANWVLQHVDPNGASSTWAGKGAGYLQVGGLGAIIGGAAGGPVGAAIGGGLGVAYAAGADWWKGPAKPAPDPWGTFLTDVKNAKPHRPAREVKAF